MCLILIGRGVHPKYKLVIAANRDEYYDRPTAQLSFWEDHPQVLAGRDLKNRGTWLGVTARGRLAAVTNFRDPQTRMENALSRGLLVSDFLVSTQSAKGYLGELEKRAADYNGFNLLVGDEDQLFCFSNRGDTVELGTGVFGLSNHLLDTPWPKVEKGKKGLEAALEQRGEDLVERLLAVLDDREKPPDHTLPDTGVGLEWERILSPIFITSPNYGTRSSSAALFEQTGRITFIEQTFVDGKKKGEAVIISIEGV